MRDTDLGIDRTVATPWASESGPSDAIDDADTSAGGGAAALAGDPLLDERAASFAAVAPVGSTLSSPNASAQLHPTTDREPVQAVAAVDGHPLHPTFVPLPIGAFVGAFLSDLAYVRTHDPFWARSARLLTTGGIVTGLLAGSLGAMDFTGRRQIRSHGAAWVHAGGNLAVVGLAVLSASLRSKDERRAIENGALAISALSATMLLVTGWLGGELAYRHRIGVTRS